MPRRRPPRLLSSSLPKWFRTTRTSVQALDDLNLYVDGGEFVCLVGPSGRGKSTLLDIIAGLTLPDEGQVFADGVLVQGPGRHRLVMFQESALFPWLNVFGNVTFGLRRVAGLGAAKRRRIADYHLHLVGLAKFKKAYMHELSGGTKQRAALTRPARAPNGRAVRLARRHDARATLFRPAADLERAEENDCAGHAQRAGSGLPRRPRGADVAQSGPYPRGVRS